ncbi:MAG TPA: aminotransferase class V-fold PLP-dependent enzyme [archaeon]|nr:aminotransferase class V-fold PLP-dependent enzyme [archaeon]
MDKFARIRKRFPVTRNHVFLNNASVSPAPPFITGEAVSIYKGYNSSGGDLAGSWFRRIPEIRGKVARLVNASSGEIFFTKNTSEGLILAAQGFPWRPGDNVVTLQGEFPAVTVPFSLLSHRGVALRLVPPREDNSYALEDIEAALDDSTRMLVVSFVEFHTGFRNDLASIGRLCREREVFFVVDGVQGVGALQTDVRGWGVDLLSVGGHKWMLSGEGIGFCYLHAGSLEKLEPVACSWLSLDNAFDFLVNDVSEASFEKPLRSDAQRFEGGTLNVAGIFALGKSVETLLELGPRDIENRILSLGARAVNGLIRKGYRVTSPQLADQRSGITCFRSERLDNKSLLHELRRQGFSLGFPCGSIRISPHYYNNEEDIDSLLQTLPDG